MPDSRGNEDQKISLQTRRRLLTGTGAFLTGVAGCTTGPSGPDDEGPTTIHDQTTTNPQTGTSSTQDTTEPTHPENCEGQPQGGDGTGRSWPQFGFDQRNTGHSPEVAAPKAGKQQWAFEAESPVGAPVVADGTVYFGTLDGKLYAVDADTAEKQWIFQAEGTGMNSYSPAVYDETIFAPSVTSHKDSMLHAINATTGEQEWAFELLLGIHGTVSTAPTVANGTVFIGSDDNHLYAVNAQTGEEKWTFKVGNDINSTPAVADGIVFFGSLDNYLYAVDAKTGEEQWTFLAEVGDADITTSPAVYDGSVYFGGERKNLFPSLYSLNAKTGKKEWQFNIENGVRASPAVADGTVIVGGKDNVVYALDTESGEKQWEFAGIWATSPAVADSTVFFEGLDRSRSEWLLYALDAETGTKQWTFGIQDHLSPPAMNDGTVFVGSSDGRLYAIGECE